MKEQSWFELQDVRKRSVLRPSTRRSRPDLQFRILVLRLDDGFEPTKSIVSDVGLEITGTMNYKPRYR